MHLLFGSPTSVPEFCSLSLVLKPSPQADLANAFSEPLLLASPLTSLSMNQALQALKELHMYLAAALKAASSTLKLTLAEKLAVDWLREDEKLNFEEVQIFRPTCASGVGLHYRLIRSSAPVELAALTQHVLNANRGNKGPAAVAPASTATAVVFVVGISGLPSAHASNTLVYSIQQRMNDCIGLLTKLPTNLDSTPIVVKTTLSTFMLQEEEHRKTNEMVSTPNLLVIEEEDEQAEFNSLRAGVLGLVNATGLRQSRKLAQSMRNEAAKTAAGEGDGGDNDDNGDDHKGGGKPAGSLGVELTFLNGNPSELARHMSEQINILSVAEIDVFLRKFALSGQERKANLDLTGGGKSRFRRRKSDNDADLDGFDYKGPVKTVTKRKALAPTGMSESERGGGFTAGGLQLRQPKKDTRTKGTTVPALPSRGDGRGRFQDAGPVIPNGFDPFNNPAASSVTGGKSGASRRGRSQGQFFDDESSLISDNRSAAQDSVSSQARVQVNIALNEDLACSYKHSQMSSCSVEGVVQVQVKATSHSTSPFFLLLRDPACHVDSLQENKKFADDVSHSTNAAFRNGQEEAPSDRKFAVSIPKGENYFPVLRYKCVSDLRPVPIRVQTRVKVEGGFCRVALQISSNPNNEASLTDLTIIMGVPDEVNGESLVTQPAGGVWNESKRSVIWCVSELGGGEKFQLQARFELVGELSSSPENEKPMFPVLVRCQCLFAQLSGVELEVRDIPEVFPADISMKLARRFRLVHRERS